MKRRRIRHTRPASQNTLLLKLEQLSSELQRAREERAYLQMQLEWVLYRLEQLNPEGMQQTLGQLSEWMSDQNVLSSEVGIDYRPLLNALATQQWRQADELTWTAILQAAGRQREGWLGAESMQSFPLQDLHSINGLWEQYSGGQFGLGMQQRLWQEVGGRYGEFCDRVGWRVRGNWLYYNELTFNLGAMAGHLPVLAWRKRACYGVGGTTAGESLGYFFGRWMESVGGEEERSDLGENCNI